MYMKNNKGFGRFETVVVILLTLGIFAFLFKVFIDGSGGKNFDTMRSDAANFGKAVTTNADFFHNSGMVSLGEAIGEKTIEEIKSPVGRGKCDVSESEVVLEDGKYLVTLRCGDYLIENETLTTIDKAKIYKVGKWSEDKSAGSDHTTLYNCEDNGKEVYPDYYEEQYFVYRVNQDNETGFFTGKDAEKVCKVLTKEVYRTKEEVKE